MNKISRRNFLKAMGITAGVAALAGCGGSNNESGSNAGNGKKDTPLVVGATVFNSKFSPFFAENAEDQDVVDMTQVGLLTLDRNGAIVENAIKGETRPYNGKDYTYTGMSDLKITQNDDGTVYYDFTIRDDVKFSDGEPLTIDDVIFGMYVACDPTFDGLQTLFSQPILGMEEYRSGMKSRMDLILATERKGYEATDFYTEEQYNKFWEAFDKAGEAFAQEIVDAVVAAMGEMSVAEAAAAWNIAGLAEDATAADLFKKLVEMYGYDLSDNGINAEKAGTAITDLLLANLGDAADEMRTGVQTGNGAEKIEGIQKTGDYSLRIVTTEFSATTIYQLGGTIAPLHYYGDKSLYDYDANKFGFPKGDLSKVRSVSTQPLGAGPYKFVKFERGVVYFEANENYYMGAPKTKYINFKETQEVDKLNGIVTGTIDLTTPSFSKDVVSAIEQANSNGELSGDKITVDTIDYLGYGYIGINAKRINVEGDPASEASKNLRKALCTVLAVYRDVAINSYYGERASVINYPISSTSWAAPKSTDADYKVAFSVDAEGNDIYTSSMTAEDKYAAALQAALGFLEKAGYTVEGGKVTAAPKGAKLEYELTIGADGTGDHPTFMVCSKASDALKTIGINLIINDLSNPGALFEGIEAGTLDIFVAAWRAAVDPDMYQVYYSDVANGGKNPGGSNSHYNIADPELDELILEARSTAEQDSRKAMYKACLDIIIDWAVEVPIYQRQDAVIYSTERVDVETVTPDITPFYPWKAEIDKIEMNANK